MSALALATLASGVAFGGSVKEVDAKKKIVTVELGEDETMEKDAEVCFFTEKAKLVDCGTATKVKGTAATVKLKTAKKLKRIKPGMIAKVGKEPPDKAGEEGGEEGEGGKKGAKGAAVGKKPPLRIMGLYLPSFATPSTYKKVAYDAPTVDQPDTLWSQDGEVKSSLVGVGLAVGIPIGTHALDIGLRYRTFTPSVIDADYVEGQLDPYTSTEQKATAFGLFFDYEVLRSALSPALFFDLATGLDIDMSTVTMTTKKKDDSGQKSDQTGTLATATSKLTVMSLRLGPAMEFMVAKSFGLRFGLDVLVPLAAAGASFSGKLDEKETKKPSDPTADMKKAIDHKKGSVSFGLNLGMLLAF